jgi:hypothetical protein
MNALTHHARFLRPLRSVLLVPHLATIAFSLSQTFLRLDLAAAKLSACLVALPLLAGIFIAGAAHEPLHRPFALLLPGLRERQRRFAIFSTALAALAIASITRWTTPAIPSAAALGLIAALVALPQLGSHRFQGFLSSHTTEFFVWLLLCLAFASNFALLLTTFPIPLLLVGFGFAAFCFYRGYSREICRRRARTPYISVQTRFFCHLFQSAASERWQNECKAAGKNPSVPVPTLVHRRSIQPLGSSAISWLPVLRELAFGEWRNAMSHRLAWTAGVMLLGGFALFPVIGVARGQPDYFTSLAHIIDPRRSINVQCIGAMAFWVSVTLPTFPLPISRARLGRTVFLHFVTCWLFALLMPVAVLLLPSLVGQWVSGQTLPAYGVRPLLVTTLTLASLLPLVLAANLNPARRHITMFLSISLTVILSPFLEKRIAVYRLEPVGGLIFAALIAGSLLLMRWHILRHYATCDLLSGAAPNRSP